MTIFRSPSATSKIVRVLFAPMPLSGDTTWEAAAAPSPLRHRPSSPQGDPSEALSCHAREIQVTWILENVRSPLQGRAAALEQRPSR